MSDLSSVKALVIGMGSIGQRHFRVLQELGCEVVSYSLHLKKSEQNFHDLKEALVGVEYVVICNATHLHAQTLKDVRGFGFEGSVMVEKPLFHQMVEMDATAKVSVAYQLRFHPVLQELKKRLEGQRLFSFNAYVGQDVRTWRPNRSYKESYSAQKKQGGGVLRDLSHELDYALWFCGDWQELTALGGQFSDLEIDCEDSFSILAKTEKCPQVTIEMNYLDQAVQRRITVNTERGTYVADLVRGTLRVCEEGRKSEELSFENERDVSFLAQHRAALQGQTETLCSYQEGYNIVQAIEMIEEAAADRKWVKK